MIGKGKRLAGTAPDAASAPLLSDPARFDDFYQRYFLPLVRRATWKHRLEKEDARDVVSALGENLVIPRRSRKATLAGGDGRFPFQFLASIKVSLLFGKIDNDSWRVRAAFVIPPAGRYRGGQSSSHRLLHSGWQLSAATEKDRNRRQGEKPNELDRFHEARKVCSECLLRVLFNGTKIRRFLRLSIGLWSHMRTLITQPNSNLRKTFNAFPKQNSDENVQRNGDMRFLFDNRVHFRCDFCCNDPLKIRANQVQCAAIQQKLCLHGAGACEFWSSKITPTR